MSVRHCPSCGSTRSYAYVHKVSRKNSLTGELEEHQKYRCIPCGTEYIDAEREFCHAPVVSTQLVAQRLRAMQETAKAGIALSSEEKKMVKAIKTIVPESEGVIVPTTVEEKEKELDKIKHQLRCLYADERVAGKRHTMTMDEFVDEELKRLRDAKVIDF
jgi:hypothetical protein